jgi:hypothetical protein
MMSVCAMELDESATFVELTDIFDHWHASNGGGQDLFQGRGCGE